MDSVFGLWQGFRIDDIVFVALYFIVVLQQSSIKTNQTHRTTLKQLLALYFIYHIYKKQNTPWPPRLSLIKTHPPSQKVVLLVVLLR